MSQTPQDPTNPPGPGWWLASDGNWYPPQPPTPPGPPGYPPGYAPPAPPVAPNGNKGCLIAVAVAGTIFVVVGVLIAIVIWKVADTVKDVADGVTVGEVTCPSAEDVSDLIGYQVDLTLSGSLLVASGCNYTSVDASGGAGVSIVSGAGLIADEVLAEIVSEAQSNGTQASSIDEGEDGLAYGSELRSAAAAKADGRIVQVDIFAEGTQPIGDQKDAAVEILGDFIDLNY